MFAGLQTAQLAGLLLSLDCTAEVEELYTTARLPSLLVRLNRNLCSLCLHPIQLCLPKVSVLDVSQRAPQSCAAPCRQPRCGAMHRSICMYKTLTCAATALLEKGCMVLLCTVCQHSAGLVPVKSRICDATCRGQTCTAHAKAAGR